MLISGNVKGRGVQWQFIFGILILWEQEQCCASWHEHTSNTRTGWRERRALSFPKGKQRLGRRTGSSQFQGVGARAPTSCACLENASALAIMLAVLSSSSPSFCPLSSRAMRARVRSPMTPPAAPLTPSIPPDPGMCWARLREAFPAVASPTAKENGQTDSNELLAWLCQCSSILSCSLAAVTSFEGQMALLCHHHIYSAVMCPPLSWSKVAVKVKELWNGIPFLN